MIRTPLTQLSSLCSTTYVGRPCGPVFSPVSGLHSGFLSLVTDAVRPPPFPSQLYTDHITFAPLTSSFLNSSHPNISPSRARETWMQSWLHARPGRPRPASAKSMFVLADKMGLVDLKKRAFARELFRRLFELTSRAKRVERRLILFFGPFLVFADIVSGLTVSNAPSETFSAFSAAFDEVRKVEVAFFLQVRFRVSCNGTQAFQSADPRLPLRKELE